MTMSICLSMTGVVLTCAGALCFGYDLFRPFKGKAYGGIDASNADGYAHPTMEFRTWESLKMRWYKIGALLVIVGSTMQLLGSYIPTTSLLNVESPRYLDIWGHGYSGIFGVRDIWQGAMGDRPLFSTVQECPGAVPVV